MIFHSSVQVLDGGQIGAVSGPVKGAMFFTARKSLHSCNMRHRVVLLKCQVVLLDKGHCMRLQDFILLSDDHQRHIKLKGISTPDHD